MNKLIAFIFIIVLNYVLSFFLPWWNLIFVVFIIVAFTRLSSKSSWFIPMFAVMASWLVQIFIMDQMTEFRSSQRIAGLFEAPAFASYLIPILTAGLLAALSGYLSYLIFHKTEKGNEEHMTVEDYRQNTPGLEDKDII